MSGRGPRGGRGVGRGRGRGRGKTQIWEWESYTPGAEVYQQLWRVRKEPAIVTARLPNDCPMPNAQTRILNRRQTGDTVNREQYTVEIVYTNEAGSGHEDLGRMEVEEVDLRRILQFVSPAELERYETEQFRLEAEAEAIAIRTETEDLARRQLQKNAKAPENKRGNRMLSGLGLPVAQPIRARGKPRGSRGRGRGRYRGLVLSPPQPEDDKRAELVDSEPTATNRQTGHIRPPTQTSPGMARSAFVANSALPESLVSRRLTGCRPLQEHTDLSGLEDGVGVALAGRDAKSVAALSPSIDRFPQAATLAAPSSTQGSSYSAALGAQLDDMFAQTPLFFDRSSIAASDSDDSKAAQPPLLHHESNEDINNDTMQMHIRRPDHQSLEYNNNNDADAEGAKEYVVEAIMEHFREDGKSYYLVKWDGYEDSHDWLPEEDLEGAADLVAEYKERVGWRNKKER